MGRLHTCVCVCVCVCVWGRSIECVLHIKKNNAQYEQTCEQAELAAMYIRNLSQQCTNVWCKTIDGPIATVTEI